MNRRIVLPAGLVAGALAIAGFVALRLPAEPLGASSEPAAPPAPLVTVAAVEQRTLTESEELTGRVDSLETVDLRAEVGGRLVGVHFSAGDLVEAGTVLFTIDPRTYEANLDAARAAVARAEALAATAARDADRAESLFERQAISTEEVDLRRSRAAEAAAGLLAARADLARASLDFERTHVKAPITGRVSRALVTPGNLVSPATALTTLVSTGDAYVYADISESTFLKYQRLDREGRISRDAQGRIPVELQLADETAYTRRGYIESTDNRLSSSTGTLLVRMVFPNPDQALVPGLFARVRVPLGEPRPTLLIGERAIGTDQSQKFVLTVDDTGKAAYRSVELGSSIDGMRVVRSGLQPGERVIVNGLQRVRPGMNVTTQQEVASAPAASLAVARR